MPGVELGRDAAHRHRVEPFGVGDADRGLGDLLAREARPARRGGFARPQVERSELLGRSFERFRFLGELGRGLLVPFGDALELGRLLRDAFGDRGDPVEGVARAPSPLAAAPAVTPVTCHSYSVLLSCSYYVRRQPYAIRTIAPDHAAATPERRA